MPHPTPMSVLKESKSVKARPKLDPTNFNSDSESLEDYNDRTQNENPYFMVRGYNPQAQKLS